MNEFLFRTARQICLLAALWMLLNANASNFDRTEIKTWIGMVMTGLVAETVGAVAKKFRGGNDDG